MRLAASRSFRPALIAAPALAQQPGVPAPEAAGRGARRPAVDDARVNQLIIYGDDPCPAEHRRRDHRLRPASGGRPLPHPAQLRNDPNDPASQSWANRALELSYAGRVGTDSCSPVGGGGFTGCFNQLVQPGPGRAPRRREINWDVD